MIGQEAVRAGTGPLMRVEGGLYRGSGKPLSEESGVQTRMGRPMGYPADLTFQGSVKLGGEGDSTVGHP